MRPLEHVGYTTYNTAAIVQWQNAALWQRMSWVRNPLAAPKLPPPIQRPVPRKPSALPARLFAGTSGWAYPTWKPGFYPQGTSAKKFLSFYASQLNSVEVNYTFTKLPTAATVGAWLAQTPPAFRFSFKAPQRITHFRRLLECEQQVTDFLNAISPVQDAGKMGLILFQLPPNFKANPTRLRDFLTLFVARSPLPLAFEFRHASWFIPETFNVLTRYNAALCIAESDTLVSPEVHTADTHACFRLRRNGGYKPRQLSAFAVRFNRLAQGRDVYAYFKHQDEPAGALDARAFLKASGRAERGT